MPEIDPVILRLIADDGKYRASLNNVVRANERTEASATRLAKTVDRSMDALKGALAGVSVLALAQGFLSLADEAKKLDAQLRLATAGFGSFAKAQSDVRRIADETRSGLSETASLYGNFVRGAKELGATQAEAARATETFSKTLKISGADTNQAASATLQFGQALAAGALRGDELNSILEASPRLARLLAESMGQPIGQIKQLGEQGLLTSDKLLRALTDKKFTASIDAEFRQMPITFDEAVTKVYNAAVTTFGAFDRGGEFSTMLANFVTDGADGFDKLERSAEDFGISVRSNLAGLANAFQPFVQAGLSAFEQLGGGAFNLTEYIRQSLREADALLNIGPSVANFFGAGGKYDSRLLERFDARQKQVQNSLRGSAQQNRFDAQMSAYDIFGNLRAGNEPSTAPRARAASSGAKSTRRTSSSRAKSATKKAMTFEEQIAAIEDNYERAQAASEAFIRKVNEGFLSVGLTQDDLDGSGIRDMIDNELKLREEMAEKEAEYRKQLHDKEMRRQEDEIRFLADIFEDGFRGGTKAIWRDFKDIGLRILAEMAARFAILKLGGGSGDSSIGGIFSAAASSVFGFGRASGGYVGPGQMVRVNEAANPGRVEGFQPTGSGHIIPLGRMNALPRSAPTTVISAPTFDLSKAVITPQLYADMQRISNESAARYSGAMGKQVLRAVPARIAQYDADGI